MKNESTLLLFVLILIVFVSGCSSLSIPGITGAKEEQRHDVIEIQGIKAIPQGELHPGQSIRLQVLVKNLQQPEYEPIDVDVGLYNDCGLFETKGVTCTRGQWESDVLCKINNMFPQSVAVVEWSLTAKDVNVKTTCNIGIQAKYHYTTYSTYSVTFLNKVEAERIVTSGKKYSDTGKLIVGEGPVKPYMEIRGQPILINTDKKGKDAGSGILTFWVEDKGRGMIDIKQQQDKTNLLITENSCRDFDMETYDVCISVSTTNNKIVTDIESDKGKMESGVPLYKCIQERFSTGASDGNMIERFYMIDRSTPKITCVFYLRNPEEIVQEKTYQINSEIAYVYRFTKEYKITIKPNVKV